MIEASLYVLDGKLCFVAELAVNFFNVFLFLEFAAIAVVDLFVGDLLQSVAGQVETGVAAVAVQDLVGVVVETAEADLAVGFEELFGGGCVFALGWFDRPLAFHELLELLVGFVCIAVFEVFEYGGPHEVVSDSEYFFLGGEVGLLIVLLD